MILVRIASYHSSRECKESLFLEGLWGSSTVLEKRRSILVHQKKRVEGRRLQYSSYFIQFLLLTVPTSYSSYSLQFLLLTVPTSYSSYSLQFLPYTVPTPYSYYWSKSDQRHASG
ncbi:hypothetical protein AVEN_31327-1 [Araneus ventricosus]|uniref:Uncharacterized protein n=1 Tax=Araneus ventricosus TaxID=182803 RepID=A0A4Y2S754_ARAVE|nr:hypothetical protein AVEN_31327-1 [Araneus ventricosus]